MSQEETAGLATPTESEQTEPEKRPVITTPNNPDTDPTPTEGWVAGSGSGNGQGNWNADGVGTAPIEVGETGLTDPEQQDKDRLIKERAGQDKYWEKRERQRADRELRESRTLDQDKPQFFESKYSGDVSLFKKDTEMQKESDVTYKGQTEIFGKEDKYYKKKLGEWEVADTKYKKDLIKYNKEKAKYDSDLIIYNKELKVHEEATAKYEKDLLLYNNTIKQYEKQDARWYVIDRYEPLPSKIRTVHKGGSSHTTVTTSAMRKRHREAYVKKWASKNAHNAKLNALYGGRPQMSVGNIGILQRSVADKLFGKTATPTKQFSSSAQRQIRLYYLGQRYKNTSMTANEFRRAKASITKTVADKAAAEQQRRNWSSAISAKSAAVNAQTQYDLKIKQMTKENRLSQMAAQTAQNTKVNLDLKKAGIDASRLKIAKGKPQQLTQQSPVKLSKPVNAASPPLEEKPVSPMSIFDIPQSQFAAMQANRGLTEKFDIGSFQSSDQGKFMNVKPMQPQEEIKSEPSGATMFQSGVSPLLVNKYLLQVQAAKIKQEKMQDQPPKPTWKVGDKTFISLKAAEKYQSEQPQTPIITGMSDLAPAKTIIDNTKHSNFWEGYKTELFNVLRYSDAVDAKEVERKGLFDDVQYYASTSLKPLTDIGLSVSNLVGGTDYTITPSFASTVIDVPLQIATQGKTDVHDPIGDFVKKDPLRTILQVPAEAALWVSGTKLLEVTPKVIRAISPIKYLKPEVEGKVFYRGIGYSKGIKQGKPILGKYAGTSGLQKGYKPDLIPWKNVKLTDRTGGKLGTAIQGGTGQKYFFYSPKALDYQLSKGYINPLGKMHAERAVALHEATEAYKGIPHVGKFDPNEFANINKPQVAYSKSWVELQQQAGKIEPIHGSPVMNVSTPASVKALTNRVVLKIGDIDVTPIFPKKINKIPRHIKQGWKKEGLDFEEQGKFYVAKEKARFADELLESYALGKEGDKFGIKALKTGFPLNKGQVPDVGTTKYFNKIESVEANKWLKLKTGDAKPVKMFEVVIPKSPETSKIDKLSSLFRTPPKTRQLDTQMSEKTIRVGGGKLRGGMKYADAQYQRLSQYETAFARQEWQPWTEVMKKTGGLKPQSLWQKKLDTPAKMAVRPAEGRITKDTARQYWQALSASKAQSKGLRPDLGRKTVQEAEKFKSSHPEINFGEKFKLDKIDIETSIKPTSVTPLLSPSTRLAPASVEGSRMVTGNILKPHALPKDKKPALSTSRKLVASKPKPLTSSSKPFTSSSKLPVKGSASLKPSASSSIIKSKETVSVWTSSSVSSSKRKKRGKEDVLSTVSSSPSKPKKKSGKPVFSSTLSTAPSSIRPPPSSGSSSSGKIKVPKIKPKIPTTKTPPISTFKVNKPKSTLVSVSAVGDTSTRPITKKKGGLWYTDNVNKKKEKKGKSFPTHDFLGNMRLDQIEGMFRRKEVIHGDKRTHKQVKKDKKKGFKELNVRIF